MAKIVKKAVIKRGNVTTIYKNTGDTPEGNPNLYPGLVNRSTKGLKQRPVKRSPKKIGNI